MKKLFLFLVSLAISSVIVYAADPEMQRQYEIEQEKCQKYGGSKKNAVYKGTTYGSSSSTEHKGSQWNQELRGGGSLGTSNKVEAGGSLKRSGEQKNRSESSNTNNRWECE